jgi:hypothetical protein
MAESVIEWLMRDVDADGESSRTRELHQAVARTAPDVEHALSRRESSRERISPKMLRPQIVID